MEPENRQWTFFQSLKSCFQEVLCLVRASDPVVPTKSFLIDWRRLKEALGSQNKRIDYISDVLKNLRQCFVCCSCVLSLKNRKKRLKFSCFRKSEWLKQKLFCESLKGDMHSYYLNSTRSSALLFLYALLVECILTHHLSRTDMRKESTSTAAGTFWTFLHSTTQNRENAWWYFQLAAFISIMISRKWKVTTVTIVWLTLFFIFVQNMKLSPAVNWKLTATNDKLWRNKFEIRKNWETKTKKS